MNGTVPRISVFLVAICMALPAQQESQKTPKVVEHALGQRLAVQGIPNFGEVTSTLYRGAQPREEGIEALKKLGIEVVVNLRVGLHDKEEASVEKLGMRYVAIPFPCQYPKDATFARFLAVIQDNQGKKIFVHCHLGEDRTGLAVAVYRMAQEGWTAEKAMKEMRAFGFSSAHHLTCPGLANYEKHFPEHLKSNAVFKELYAEQPLVPSNSR